MVVPADRVGRRDVGAAGVRAWLVGADGAVVGEDALPDGPAPARHERGGVRYLLLEARPDGTAVYREDPGAAHRHAFEVVLDGAGEPVGLACVETEPPCPAASGWRVGPVA